MINAEGDATNAVAPGSLVHRVHQHGTDPSPSEPLDDGNRQLRRVLVDEAFTVLRRGEQAAPRQPDELPVVVDDERRVAWPSPPLVEDRDLRVGNDELLRGQLAVRSPIEGGIQHLAKEVQLPATKVTDDHPETCRRSKSIPQF